MKACQELQWNHDTSTPHRSETHGVAERAVGESERRNLLQSHLFKVAYQKNGGTQRFIASVTCETRRTDWQMAKQNTKGDFERRLTDQLFLLEQPIEYIPITAEDKSRVHHFGNKMLKGILWCTGGWSGDFTDGSISAHMSESRRAR